MLPHHHVYDERDDRVRRYRYGNFKDSRDLRSPVRYDDEYYDDGRDHVIRPKIIRDREPAKTKVSVKSKKLKGAGDIEKVESELKEVERYTDHSKKKAKEEVLEEVDEVEEKPVHHKHIKVKDVVKKVDKDTKPVEKIETKPIKKIVVKQEEKEKEEEPREIEKPVEIKPIKVKKPKEVAKEDEEMIVKPIDQDKLLGKKLDMISKIKKNLARIEDQQKDDVNAIHLKKQ